jgi:hypothetical protein
MGSNWLLLDTGRAINLDQTLKIERTADTVVFVLPGKVSIDCKYAQLSDAAQKRVNQIFSEIQPRDTA